MRLLLSGRHRRSQFFVYRTPTHFPHVFPPVVSRFIITTPLSIPPTTSTYFYDSPLSIFLLPLYILNPRPSCVPQPRISGVTFYSLRNLRSNQRGVITIPVKQQGIRLYFTSVSIDATTRIRCPPPPPPTYPPIIPYPGPLPTPSPLFPTTKLITALNLSQYPLSSSFFLEHWYEGSEGEGAAYSTLSTLLFNPSPIRPLSPLFDPSPLCK